MLGYATDANPESQTGPQPYEGYVSDVCETFHCLPDAALRQDPRIVREIMEFRAARTAIELFRGGNAGAEQLAKSPGLLAMLATLTEAQIGIKPKPGDLLRGARERGD